MSLEVVSGLICFETTRALKRPCYQQNEHINFKSLPSRRSTLALTLVGFEPEMAVATLLHTSGSAIGLPTHFALESAQGSLLNGYSGSRDTLAVGNRGWRELVRACCAQPVLWRDRLVHGCVLISELIVCV